MSTNDYIIEIKNISKSFGDKVILDDVSINVKRGEFVTILGPSSQRQKLKPNYSINT